MKIKNKFLIVLGIVFLICSFILASFISPDFIVKAGEEENGIIYTDSDEILDGEYTIFDYPTDLLASKAALKHIGGRYRVTNIEEDDPIVAIVPEEEFYTIGERVEVGQEYGYFITTELCENGYNYKSTVLVFDIDTETDLSATVDRVIVSVSPIFSYEYICISNQYNSVTFDNLGIDYEMQQEYCVFPDPDKYAYDPTYAMSDRYYMKDISFGASLFNMQQLNSGDSGYDPHEDYGSYFTGFDYSYNGVYRENGEFPLVDTAISLLEVIAWGVGCVVPAASVLGIALPKIVKLLNIADAVTDGISLVQDLFDSTAQLVETEKKITATCFYQNRDDQLEHYKDSEGNPQLMRTAALACNTDTDKSVWFGVGHDVTGYFNIGHSALNGRAPYQMLFTNDIAVKIVDSETDEVVAIGDGITSNTLRSPEYKDVAMEEEGAVYMLPEGEDHFVYPNVPFESDYAVDIHLTDNATVTVNGQSYYGKDFLITENVEKG